MATPGRKKKPHFFHGRGSCERCGGKMRVEEWSLPWDKATGYTCERCVYIYSYTRSIAYRYMQNRIAIIAIVITHP